MIYNYKYIKHEYWYSETVKSEITSLDTSTNSTNLDELNIDFIALSNYSVNKFKSIGMKYGTDKAKGHEYYNL